MQGEGNMPQRTVQSGTGQEPRKRQRSTLAGRFSGRLARKEDEAQLVVECALLGPLLGDTQPATLSTIVRSIASGRVRKYLEEHLPRGGPGSGHAAADLQAAWQSRAAIAAAEAQSQQLAQAQAELNALKARLWDSAARTAELEKQGAIQQRMLQMLTGGQSMPPASLAEAAAADVAAAAAQQQQHQQQQPPQQQLQQPTLPPATQQLGGGGGGFAHAQTSGFAELLNPSTHWGSGAPSSTPGGGPANVNMSAAAPRPTLSPVGPLLAPATAAALTGMAPLQQLRFGNASGDLLGSHGGNLGMPGGAQLPAFSAAPSAVSVGQGTASGFSRPKSSDGWAPIRPSNGSSAFIAPAAGSAFSPALPWTPTATRMAPAAGGLGHAGGGGDGGGGTPTAVQTGGNGKTADSTAPAQPQAADPPPLATKAEAAEAALQGHFGGGGDAAAADVPHEVVGDAAGGGDVSGSALGM